MKYNTGAEEAMPTTSAYDEQPIPDRPQLEQAILQLVEANRARCLWFASPDYLPATDAERLRALQHIERHGDLRAFVRARELRDWLLQPSSEE